MSTKTPCAKAAGLAIALAASLAACTAGPPSPPPARFSELRLGHAASDVPPPLRPASPQPSAAFAQSDEPPPLRRTAPDLRPRLEPVEPSAILPVDLDAAAGRVASYLNRAGFALEQQADGTGRRVSGTRMGPPTTLEHDAVCGLQAMHRPDIASTDLTARLTPAPGGVQLETHAAFVEIDTKLLSGALSRQTCRSRGVLEAEVRRAALGR